MGRGPSNGRLRNGYDILVNYLKVLMALLAVYSASMPTSLSGGRVRATSASATRSASSCAGHDAMALRYPKHHAACARTRPDRPLAFAFPEACQAPPK
jgi:hypothetical protein